MDLLTFFIQVELITISGALSPGPLTIATISSGSEGGWRNGLMISVGHMIVELPLVLALATGLSFFFESELLSLALWIIGGVFLICFGYMQIKPVGEKGGDPVLALGSPIMIGVSLSGANPYFIAWWFTIGSRLVLTALLFNGLIGVLLMYVVHVWVDYAWLILIAHLAYRGLRRISGKKIKYVNAALGVVLILLGLEFLRQAYLTLIQ